VWHCTMPHASSTKKANYDGGTTQSKLSPEAVVGFQLKDAPLFSSSKRVLELHDQRSKVYVRSADLLQHCGYAKIPKHLVSADPLVCESVAPDGMIMLDARKLQNSFLAGADVEQLYNGRIGACGALGLHLETGLILSATREPVIVEGGKRAKTFAEFFERFGFVLLRCSCSSAALERNADGCWGAHPDYVGELHSFIKETLYESGTGAMEMNFSGCPDDSESTAKGSCAHGECANGAGKVGDLCGGNCDMQPLSSNRTTRRNRGARGLSSQQHVHPEILGEPSDIEYPLPLTLRGVEGSGPYAAGAHQDFDRSVERLKWRNGVIATVAAQWETQRQFVGLDVLNCWRLANMREPLRHMPLALCDPQTVSEADVISMASTSFKGELKDGSNMVLRFNPRQRWFYYPRMEDNEVLIFRSFSVRRSRLKPFGSPCTGIAPGSASQQEQSQGAASLQESLDRASEECFLKHERSVFHTAFRLDRNLLQEELLVNDGLTAPAHLPPGAAQRDCGVGHAGNSKAKDFSPRERQSCECRITVGLREA